MNTNHDVDYDRDHDREDALTREALLSELKETLNLETALLRKYIVVSEKLHNEKELKHRLTNFAEGNAKRTFQLENEINKLSEQMLNNSQIFF
ncbi:hypothetical protein [Metabacillus malikii]|uniref:Uncharacterized protein n=1 Tax=Metabacillus malikii TaxID=1504265 RepID=A0ABT9ZDV9_9BACI|nr:hypothetical protein [Metabacillus malikii]MDQ0230032.1 hypothetical protein [Metabacillus malikii]